MSVQLEQKYRNRNTGQLYTAMKREWVGSKGVKMADGTTHSGYVVETDDPTGLGRGIRMEENSFLSNFEIAKEV